MDSRSKPYFYSFDTKSKPGFIIARSIRFESQEIPAEGFEATSFTLLGADYEQPAIREMFSCAHRFVQHNGLAT